MTALAINRICPCTCPSPTGRCGESDAEPPPPPSGLIAQYRSHLGVTDAGGITRVEDQSGTAATANDLIPWTEEGGTDTRWTLVPNVLNGYPAMRAVLDFFTVLNRRMVTEDFEPVAGPITLHMVINQTVSGLGTGYFRTAAGNSPANGVFWVGSVGEEIGFYVDNGTSSFFLFQGVDAEFGFSIVSVVLNGASSKLRLNGVDITHSAALMPAFTLFSIMLDGSCDWFALDVYQGARTAQQILDAEATLIDFYQLGIAPQRALKTWAGGDGRWSYSTSLAFVAGDVGPASKKYVVVTAGAGFTPGVYGIENYLNFNTGAPDGVQDMIFLHTAPAAAGTGGGTCGLFSGLGAEMLVVCKGDSITAGTGATPWPTWLQGSLGTDVYAYNGGVGGDTLDAMNTAYAADIAPLFTSQPQARKVVIIFAGTNDFYTLGLTVAQLKTRLESFCNAAKATGFEVFIVSMLPRTAGGTDPAQEAHRASYNALLRADFNVATSAARVFAPAGGITYADLLVDIAANAAYGEAGDNLDGSLYPDGVHPSNAVQQLIAADMENALEI